MPSRSLMFIGKEGPAEYLSLSLSMGQFPCFVSIRRCCSWCCGLQWWADQPNKDPAPVASSFQGETDDEQGQEHEFNPWSVLRRQ